MMLQEAYESYCRGDARRHLWRMMWRLREEGLDDEQIIARLTAEVPHINSDGAEWLVVEIFAGRSA